MSDTILLHASRGLASALASAPIDNGNLRVTTDTQKVYFDIDNVRLPLGDLVTGMTEAQIKAQDSANVLPKLYIASDTNTLYFFDSTAAEGSGEWIVAGGDSVAEAENAEFAEKDASGNVISTTYETKADATAKETAINSTITALTARVDAIHSFEIAIIADIASAPVPGASNIIYFVPHDEIAGNNNKYDEYIWVTDANLQDGGYYENIGTTEADLTNYYTKTEVDSLISSTGGDVEQLREDLEAADTALGGRIDTLSQTVTANKTALDNADTALGGRIDTLSQTVTANKTAADQTQTDLDTLEATVAAMDTAYKAADTALDGKIDALQDDVDTINRFNKLVVSSLPNVDTADDYTLYFVPEGDHYAEYMLIEVTETVEGVDTQVKRFEKINSISELSDYFTKSEVNAIKSSLEAADTANGQLIAQNTADITTLNGTVSDMDTAYKAADTALDGRLDIVEAALGTYPTEAGTQTITTRLATLEENVTGSTDDLQDQIDALDTKTDTIRTDFEDADSALSARATTLETAVGNYPTTQGTLSITDRLAQAESDIAANETDIEGKFTTLSGTVSDMDTAYKAADTALDGRVDVIETALGSETLQTDVSAMDTAYKAADTALDGRVDVIEAALGTYPTEAGTQTITTRLATLEENVTGSTDDLQDQIDTLSGTVSDMDTAYKAADTALDGRVDVIETALGSYLH